MVSLLGPLDSRCRIYTKNPKGDHNFDNHPYYKCVSISTSISISFLIWAPQRGTIILITTHVLFFMARTLCLQKDPFYCGVLRRFHPQVVRTLFSCRIRTNKRKGCQWFAFKNPHLRDGAAFLMCAMPVSGVS